MTFSPNPPQPEIKYGRPGPARKPDQKPSAKHEQSLRSSVANFWHSLPKRLGSLYSHATTRLRNFITRPTSIFRGAHTQTHTQQEIFDPTSRFISQTQPSPDASHFARFEIQDVEYEHFSGPFASRENPGESKLATLMRKERLLYEELKRFIQHYFHYSQLPEELQKRIQFLIVQEYRQGGVKEQVVRNNYTEAREHEKIYSEPLALEHYNWNKKAEETIRNNVVKQVIGYYLQDTTNYSYPFRISSVLKRQASKQRAAAIKNVEQVFQEFQTYVRALDLSVQDSIPTKKAGSQEAKNLVNNEHGKISREELNSLLNAYQHVYAALCSSNIQLDSDYTQLQKIAKGSRDRSSLAHLLPKAQKMQQLSIFLDHYTLKNPSKTKMYGDVLMHILQTQGVIFHDHPLFKKIESYDSPLAAFLKNLF